MNAILRFLFALVGVVAFAAVAFTQDLTIKGGDAKVVQVDKVVTVKEDITLVSSFPFTITAPEGGFLYSWDVPASLTTAKKGNVLTVGAGVKGRIVVSVEWVVIDFDAKKTTVKSASVAFAIGEVGPAPKPVDPPQPKPEAFIDVDGVAVLMLRESSAKLPFEQSAIFTSVLVREWLDKNCAADPANANQKAYRIWDKDQIGDALKFESKVWQDAMALKRDSLPWIVISNKAKSKFHAGPLPATVAKTLELLKLHGE